MSTSWTNPRHDGAGTWQHTAPHPETFTDLLVAFIACLLASVVLVALVVIGRHAMCATHNQALSYCPGYQAAQHR